MRIEWKRHCGVVLWLTLAGLAQAGDREVALETVDQAIKAHGGEATLNRALTFVRTASGTLHTFAKPLPFKDQLTVQLPERFRSSVEVGEQDTKFRLVVVINKDTGWQQSGGATMELTKERLGELREEAYVLYLTTLTPLKKDSGMELTPLPEGKVNDAPVIGIKVSQKGHADSKLYFDKNTHLLVKIERRVTEAGLLVTKEYLYSDHKNFGGVKLPGKMIESMNGRKVSEVSSFNYQFPNRAEESAFGKP